MVYVKISKNRHNNKLEVLKQNSNLLKGAVDEKVKFLLYCGRNDLCSLEFLFG
jgi:hypothetical protein